MYKSFGEPAKPQNHYGRNGQMRRIVLAVACLMLVLSVMSVQAEGKIKIDQGTLGASKIMIAVPEKWNRNVLILVHGLRPENTPLTADFDVDALPYRQMLKDGWMVASTSFRRNGFIVDDAILDVDDLHNYIVKTYGQPKQVFLFGGSMGGIIITTMAETHGQEYDGAVAVGAALGVLGPIDKFDPKMPVLYLTNQSETTGPRSYVDKAASATVKPAFWLVKRDGHCNTTGEEELAALRALIAYKNTGKIAFDRDGTIIPKPPASVARFEDNRAFARVKKRGNILTEFVAADLERLGIKKGDMFRVSFGDKTVTVLLGTTYSDVPKGEWIAFVQAEGLLKIARNWEDAAGTLGCKEGDELCISPITKGPR